jgi:hypothetical protein
MSAPEPMPSVRRRPIPGMTSQPVTAAPSPPPDRDPQREPAVSSDSAASSRGAELEQRHDVDASQERAEGQRAERLVSPPPAASAAPPRWPAADYGATQLKNFASRSISPTATGG